jgi:hypothetical protein
LFASNGQKKSEASKGNAAHALRRFAEKRKIFSKSRSLGG